MIIGLVLLGIVAIMIFFGLTNKFFAKIGVANWLAFIFVLALVVGAVLPTLKFGAAFQMSIGGFLVPLIIAVILMFIIGANSGLARAFISALAVASVAVAVRMLIVPTSMGMEILSAVIIGLVSGAVAVIIGKSRLAVLASSIGGIVIGDVIVSLVYAFATANTAGAVLLGAFGTFDAIIISVVTAAVCSVAVDMIRRRGTESAIERSALNTESAEDNLIDTGDLFKDENMYITDASLPPIDELNDFDDYFDDEV